MIGFPAFKDRSLDDVCGVSLYSWVYGQDFFHPEPNVTSEHPVRRLSRPRDIQGSVGCAYCSRLTNCPLHMQPQSFKEAPEHLYPMALKLITMTIIRQKK